MRYMCAACGKTLDWEGEEARFCPFCGRAYAAPAAEGVRADAVQAKYWQLTRAAYWEALDEMADVQNNQSRKKGRAFCLERLTEVPSKEQAKQGNRPRSGDDRQAAEWAEGDGTGWRRSMQSTRSVGS